MIDFLGIPSLPPVASMLWVVCALLKLLQWLIIIRVMVGWLVGRSKIYEWLCRLTEPAVAPFRKLSYRLMKGRLPLDMAPVFGYVAIGIVVFILSPIVFRLNI